MSTNAPAPGLKPLSAYASEPLRSVRLISVLLLIAAGLLTLSLPYPWHHLVIPAAGYRVVRGIDGDSWVLAIAALCLVLAVICWLKPPEFYSKWSLNLITFAVMLGMVVDYADWTARAAQLYVDPYFGPGFYVALAGTALVVAATVRSWFVRV